MQIDYYAYQSRIRGWNAAFKVLIAVATLFLVILFNRILVSLFVVAAMGALTLLVGRTPWRVYLRYMLAPVVFLLFSCLAVAVSFSGSPAGEWNVSVHFFYLCMGQESLEAAVKLFFKVLAGVSALYMMSFSTPADELVLVLEKLHLPGMFLELMQLVYRYIFILFDAASQMQTAAKARLGDCNIRQSFKTFAAIGGNLFVAALKKGNTYYDALLARGYQGRLELLTEEKPVRFWQAALGGLYFSIVILLNLA
ncbi:cobalt ECF transporter T component CbiQ [bacterium D16-51]|nr:cobalt ECF transporter T component CbiQ [bacterium D16-59]RKI62869.1 cobalt ECF transporter T component CbiQ [bacterium D16-51]